MKTRNIFFIAAVSLLMACSGNDKVSDGYGNFETDECILSAEVPGKIVSFPADEGDVIDSGKVIAVIDTVSLHLKKMQVAAQKKAVASKVSGILAQIEVLKKQKENLESEINRAEKLVGSHSIPSKQLDDLRNQLEVVKKQMEQVRTQNEPVLYEKESLDFQLKQIEDQIARSIIHAPFRGTIIEKYARGYEYVAPGKSVCRIAALETMYLRAYIGERQLAMVKTGMRVTVLFDEGNELSRVSGQITWISSEAEFTPKTIQTRDERESLVYALKIKVKNDGRIKTGMPGEFVITSE